MQESEGEDAETSRVVLEAPAAGRAGRALVGRQSRVRLHEVGPRLELEIIKVRPERAEQLEDFDQFAFVSRPGLR